MNNPKRALHKPKDASLESKLAGRRSIARDRLKVTMAVLKERLDETFTQKGVIEKLTIKRHNEDADRSLGPYRVSVESSLAQDEQDVIVRRFHEPYKKATNFCEGILPGITMIAAMAVLSITQPAWPVILAGIAMAWLVPPIISQIAQRTYGRMKVIVAEKLLLSGKITSESSQIRLTNMLHSGFAIQPSRTQLDAAYNVLINGMEIKNREFLIYDMSGFNDNCEQLRDILESCRLTEYEKEDILSRLQFLEEESKGNLIFYCAWKVIGALMLAGVQLYITTLFAAVSTLGVVAYPFMKILASRKKIKQGNEAKEEKSLQQIPQNKQLPEHGQKNIDTTPPETAR